MNHDENKIFDTIKSGKVKMRPRWYFILQATLGIVASVVLFFAIIFLTIFTVFIQHETGAGLAVSYGLTGWLIFLRALPWTLILTAIVFIILLAILAKRYAFVYQRPLIYALMGIVVLVVIFTLIITATPFYSAVFTATPGSSGVFIDDIYHYETTPLGSVHRGEVTLIANNGFLLQNSEGETSTVIFAPGTALKPGDFRAGEQVVVFGGRGQDGLIEAFGVQKL